MGKYLTKSLHKLALSCPTKLYYNSFPEKYGNAKLDDPFLESLAKGGFQVGELAKCYYPGGADLENEGTTKALETTKKLLEKENIVIFEATVEFKGLLVRIDILEKIGNHFNLIEVKSKSADPETFEDEIWNKRDLQKNIYNMKSSWKSYLYDVAFQSYVLKKAYPRFSVNSYLMRADKSKVATVDGLNQKFRLIEENGRTRAEPIGDVSIEALGEQILCLLDVNDVVDIIHSEREISERFDEKGFEGSLWYFHEMLNKKEKIISTPNKNCKSCEFVSEEGKLSGFNECWKLAFGITDEELTKPLSFDVWNYRGSDKAIESGKHLMEELDSDDFTVVPRSEEAGLSQSERQWLQVEKEKNGDSSSYFDLANLKDELDSWTYPLNMIDFETCMVAIPFNKGRRPYEQIAFQFSHHLIHEDGKIEHATEFISSAPGVYPNYEFLRALKKTLESNGGSIFRYANHENTVLCQIRDQLLDSKEPDADKLVEFIETITHKKEGKNILWEGERDMIDLCELVKRFYYSPKTKGSNSIKYVLPAILNESDYLKEKYSNPIYGKGLEIESKNFNNHIWITFADNGNVIDPYKTLPPIFDQYDYEALEFVMSDEDINNGGAALTAYAIMQFTHMSIQERDKVAKALLRYCELDTFAMVMIVEAWQQWVKNKFPSC